MGKVISVISICLIWGCKSILIVSGNVQNLPGDIVYLCKKGDEIVDSAKVYKNEFSFKIKRMKRFIPELHRLKVRDSICYQCKHDLFLYDKPISDLRQHWSRNNFF